MSVSDTILEVVKHLPGQHSQLKHAGTHQTSSVTYEDIVSDEGAVARIHQFFESDPDARARMTQERFEEAFKKAKRFYRGISGDLVKEMLTTGNVEAKLDWSYPGKDVKSREKGLDVSMTLDPSIATMFGKWCLIIDAEKARQYGAEPFDYYKVFDLYEKAYEIRVPRSMPNSVVIGVVSPKGEFLSLSKKA